MPAVIHPFEKSVVESAGVRRANRAMVPLLEVALTETDAHGAYLYRLETAGVAGGLSAWAGLSPDTSVGAVPSGAAAAAAIVLENNAWLDSRFAGFAEFRRHRFAGVISIPILSLGGAAAVLHVCRLRPSPLKALEFAFLQTLAPSIAALLEQESEADTLRREVEKLSDQLATRKAVDRAKGILQEQFQFSEEQAYLSIRRMSRQRRLPMKDVATALIDDYLAAETRHAG
jgi:GAF domain-containing protein